LIYFISPKDTVPALPFTCHMY